MTRAVSRRQLVRGGGAALLGHSLPGIASAAAGQQAGGAGFGRARAAILVFLRGGPSHLDLWDPKPEAPAEVRGEFRAIPTTVPGIQVAETLPQLARQMHRCALVRSVSFAPAGLHDHDAAVYQVLTGRPPGDVSPSGETTAPVPLWSGIQDRASAGGAAAEPLRPPGGERPSVRERYGDHPFGQCLLAARQQVEAGARFVTVDWTAEGGQGSWDTHAGNFAALRDTLAPQLDRALAALIEDLALRGMLEEALVLVAGEFGRSPRVGVSTSGNRNAADGRDHWPHCFTMLLAGGGVRGGQVYGASDAYGAWPAEDPVDPAEVLATARHALGIPAGTSVSRAEPLLALF